MALGFRSGASALISFSALMLASSPSLAAWEEGVNYGGQGGPAMHIYTPQNVDDSPGVIVAIHYCQGTAGGVHGWFQSAADQYGFLIIAPDAPGECFVANMNPARGGEKAAIVKMVEYAISEYGADPTRVFAAGASSGACMTNALVASYPEVFAAGSVLAGVAAGAWTGGTNGAYGLCNPCTSGAQAWGDIVRNASPDFTGQRPRVQLFHGTADTNLSYVPHLGYEVDQWTNVFGLSDADKTTENNKPKQNWTRDSYKDDSGTVLLEVNIGQGVAHDLTGQGLFGDVVRFFGLDMDPPPGGTGGASGAGGSSSGGGSLGGGANGGSGTSGGAANAGGGPSSGGQAAGGLSGSAGGASGVPGAGGLASAAGGLSGVPSGGVGGGVSPGAGGAGSGVGGSLVPDDDSTGGGGCQVGVGSSSFGPLFAALTAGLGALARRRRSRS
jgi:acetylxylan esterase